MKSFDRSGACPVLTTVLVMAMVVSGCDRLGLGGKTDKAAETASTTTGTTLGSTAPETGDAPEPSGPLPKLDREIAVTDFEPQIIGTVYASDFQDLVLDRWDADGAAGRYAMGEGYFEGTRDRGSDGPDGVDQIEGYWHQPMSARRCDTERNGTHYWGRFQFNFVHDRSGFIGFWSHCEATTLDRWNGQKVRRDAEIEAKVTALLAAHEN